MTDELTDRALVLAITDSVTDRGYPPSVRELADRFGRSVSTIHERLARLARDGYVWVEPGRQRAIQVLEVPE